MYHNLKNFILTFFFLSHDFPITLILSIYMYILLHSFDTDDDSDYAIIKRIKMEPEAILSQDDDIMAQFQQDNSDLEVEPSFSLEGSTNSDDCNDGILMQHMDIREPLSTLRNLLEQRLGVELTDYSFWLQDAQMVSTKKNVARVPFVYIKKLR